MVTNGRIKATSQSYKFYDHLLQAECLRSNANTHEIHIYTHIHIVCKIISQTQITFDEI